MRTPKFLSPSAMSTWYEDRQEYYLKYLADDRPARLPQTQPMSVGSAFDGYVKSYLVKRLFGEYREGFALDDILEAQVEPHNRDWARIAGKIAFDQYVASGALADLMLELEGCLEEPRFEFTVSGNVEHAGYVGGVPLLGKPDIYFKTKEAARCIYDWKVNGYCGKRPTSPKKGYIKCTDGWSSADYKPSRGTGYAHKDAHLMKVGGVVISLAHTMEEIDLKWAGQLCTYGWLLGEDVGADFIAGIDQLACKPNPEPGGEPLIRVANHRLKISESFQFDVYKKYTHMWDRIQEGYIFDDRSREDSDARCRTLDEYHKAQGDPNDPNEAWFGEVTRDQ